MKLRRLCHFKHSARNISKHTGRELCSGETTSTRWEHSSIHGARPKQWGSIEEPLVPLHRKLWQRRLASQTKLDMVPTSRFLHVHRKITTTLGGRREDGWKGRTVRDRCGNVCERKWTWMIRPLSWMNYMWVAPREKQKMITSSDESPTQK